MASVDPRINTPLDSSSISGQMTDRAIELIGMLNKVIGVDGLGTNTLTISGELEDIKQTLSVHTVEPDVNDPHWQEKQVVYFGASHDRLNLIQEKLSENLDTIKNDIAGNVSGLFNIISSKEGLFDDYEAAVASAKNSKELEKAEKELEQKMLQELTNDEVLNEMINAFFENISLTVARMDSEIFDLLNDYDGNYSNGSTEKNAQKFLVTLPKRDGQTDERASHIVNSKDALLELILQENKEIYETRFGEGSYTQTEENSFITNQALGNFAKGSLKLDEAIINLIIEDLNLTDSQLDSIQSSTDFLDLVSQEKLLELAANHYGTSGDQEATLKELFKDHLAIETPKYYEDQRSLFDILSGKTNLDDASNENVIFNSIGNQIKRVTNSAVDLFQYGFDKVTGSNLQETIRRSPLSAIEYLERQKSSLSDDEQIQEVQTLIDDLIDKQAQALEFMIEQENKKPNADKKAVKKLEKLLKDIDTYEPNKLDLIKNQLIELGINTPEIGSDIDLNTFLNVLDEAIHLPVIHQALYGNEMREASQINAQYDGRKLPEFKNDGSPPEDNSIAPPSIGPSPLAAVLAKIGDVMLQKAHNLEKETDIPTEEWMDENVAMLETINNRLPDLGMSSAGEAFIDSLRENFKSIIKDFFSTNQPLKAAKDKSRAKFQEGETIRDDFNFLVAKGAVDDNTTLKEFEDLVKELDKVNYDKELKESYKTLSSLNDKLRDLENDPKADPNEIADIKVQIADVNNQIISLSNDQEILAAGKKVLKLKKKVEGNKFIEAFSSMLNNNYNEYQQSIIDYSNSMTDFTRDLDGDGNIDIVQTFKDSLDQANLDLDGNGENDFIDIQGIIDRIGGLSDNIQNIYGGMDAESRDINGDGKAGGIEDQSIRRLILLMFVFSMLEAGEWDYRRYEADTKISS